MKIVPASDSSLLVEFGQTISPELHRRVMALFRQLQAEADPRIRNLHPGYASLLIDFDPLQISGEQLTVHVSSLLASAENAESQVRAQNRAADLGHPVGGAMAYASEIEPETERNSATIEIPVCYDAEFAPDLADLAGFAGLPIEEVIRLHCSPTYLVYFLGFSPGFAYMGGVPEKLQMPRLRTPRKHVAAGSVGIAGSQTGIYPVDSPGGWRLIGRTPVPMFDPAATPPTRIGPGDRVRFVPVNRATFERVLRARLDRTGAGLRPIRRPASGRVKGTSPHIPAVARIRVQNPGFLTTVQDLGRPHYAHLGISPAGAADPVSFRIANLLLGNPPNAAALEMTLLGATFEFEEAAVVALTGADCDCRLNGQLVPQFQAIEVAAGAVLQCGVMRGGLRSYLAIQGGFDVPLVMGSASTDIAGRFGGFEGRRLNKGALLRGRPTQGARTRSLRAGAIERLFAPGPIRVTRGAQQDWFADEVFANLCSAGYLVSDESNRAGLRLRQKNGMPLKADRAAQLVTEGVPLGAIQVPPDSQPIILLVDQQTTGGYPKIANVIAADLHRLGQLKPRDELCFAEVSIADAVALLREQRQWLENLLE